MNVTCGQCDVDLVPTEHGWTDPDGQQQDDEHKHWVAHRVREDDRLLAVALAEQRSGFALLDTDDLREAR